MAQLSLRWPCLLTPSHLSPFSRRPPPTTKPLLIRLQSIHTSDSSRPPEPFLASGPLPPPPQKRNSMTRTIPAPTCTPKPSPSSTTASTTTLPRSSSLLLNGRRNPTTSDPSASTTSPTSSTAPNTEPYTITRTPSANLPIYHLKKRGGNLKITELKKVEGDKEVLKEQLMEFLEPKPQYIEVRKVNGVFWIKGWYKQQLENFLVAKGF